MKQFATLTHDAASILIRTRLPLLFLILSANCVTAVTVQKSPVAVISVRKDTDGLTLTMNPGTLKLQVFSARVIHVFYTRGDSPRSDHVDHHPATADKADTSMSQTKSLAVISHPKLTTWQLVETSDEVRLRTRALEVCVKRASGVISFYDRNENVVLVEGKRSLMPTQLGSLNTFRSQQDFVLPDDEAIFGLGQHQAGVMNYRNTIVHLQQENTKVAIPFLVSSRGYGLLWDNPAITDMNAGAGDKQRIPASQLHDEGDKPGGLTGRYYKDEKFGELAAIQTDPQINFDWSMTPPTGVPHDHYSIRWTGFVDAKQEGDYTFFLSGDDGVRLWVDDKLIIDDWNSIENHASRVNFAANSRHRIRLDYFQSRGNARVNLEWSLPRCDLKLTWSSEVADSIDYYFLYGPELDEVIASYRSLTGAAPMFGKWAWGFWQCKERYKSQQELLDVVAEYRKLNIPIDGIIQDWRYWDPAPWGSHQFDATRYPDPAKMIQNLHAAHTHVLISVWPKFDPESKNASELRNTGGLYSQIIPYMGKGQWVDPFNSEARRVYWQQISKMLFSYGIDGWWLDGSEPELNAKPGEYSDFATALGQGAKVYNAYPLMLTTSVYQGQRAENNDKRVFILTRSAYAGQQRNAAVTWSGDIRGNWDVFAKQIPAGINFSLSGIPYWNTDTGGFFGIDPDDSGSRELFTRWFQYSAFCPMFRVHGTGKPKEMWRFDEATRKVLIAYDELRYHLLPYIYSVSWKVTHEGYTMMRGLVMDFRQDLKVHNIPNQYLFGPSLMVNPVTKPGATTRSVYLPAGISWTDFWTGKTYAGGKTIETEAPIELMPLFVRGGAIIPYGPSVQYAMEKADPIELRIYRGANGSFTLYEDEGDNYNYEKGVYATIPISWNEAKGRLTIGKRHGNFPGMLKERIFRVVWVRLGHGAGISTTEKVDAVIPYSGRTLTVSATSDRN
jgi:alpha-D-xyloside xylohydrolase